MNDDLVGRVDACRKPADIVRLLADTGFANGLDFQTAIVRHRATPLGEVLRLFWWFNPAEGDLMFDRASAVAGLQLELMKRVEIGYYPKGGVQWSYFGERTPGDDEVDELLAEFQGIVPKYMLGTEVS